MDAWRKLFTVWLLCALSLSAGCFPPGAELSYIGNRDLTYYEDVATKIDYPDVQSETEEDALATQPPRTLKNQRKDEIWDMSLAEAVQIALENSEVIRIANTLGSPNNSLMSNPDRVPSVYDSAIQETGVLFGGRGVEAALAAFDTTFTASMLWGRNESIVESLGGGLTQGDTLVQNTGAFNSRLQKNFGYGGQFAVNHNWDYDRTNVPVPFRKFPSAYDGVLSAEYRHPLLAGAGTEFTQTAGPISSSFQGISGVNQGVAIARINNDITLASFESSVRDLVSDVEELYWRLELTYRIYDSQIAARNSALRSWREADAILKAGGARNFQPADEAQARDRYFETRASTEEALASIYETETRFRRLLGLTVNDGRVIRPSDEPISAEFTPNWQMSLTEALVERVELHSQKWNIKSLELQHTAAESLTMPRFDFVSSYGVNGFGSHLVSQSQTPLSSGYRTMAEGNQTGWTLGFELSMPIGFRQAHAQVQNIEFRLAKARAVLKAQENDVSHELSLAFQALARYYAQAQSNYNRWQAAKRRVELFEAQVRVGTATLDLVLRAQSSLASAEIAYYQSLVDYNLAIRDIHRFKGTLLEYNNIYLVEGEWTPEAYNDAMRKAWARTYAFRNKFKHTEPGEYVLPSEYEYVYDYNEVDNGADVLHDENLPELPANVPLPSKLPPLPEEDLDAKPVTPKAKPNEAEAPKKADVPKNLTAPEKTSAAKEPEVKDDTPTISQVSETNPAIIRIRSASELAAAKSASAKPRKQFTEDDFFEPVLPGNETPQK